MPRDIQNIVDEITELGSQIKMNGLIAKKFNRDTEAIKLAMKTAVDKVNERTVAFSVMMEGGVASQLEAFRRAVGEEMWATIAGNVGIASLLHIWLEEEKVKVGRAVVEEFKMLLPDDHGMTDTEILQGVISK
jgi:hypothetical protein